MVRTDPNEDKGRMMRKYKRNTLRAIRLKGRKEYAAAMRAVHAKHPIPRGHVLRKLFTHLHIGSIKAA